MAQCHKCSKNVQPNSSVQRVMQTGTHSDGKAYLRSVNLCKTCDEKLNTQTKDDKKKKALVVWGGLAAALFVCLYMLFLR